MTKGYPSFILTYRLSQDPLENFFSCIRSASSLGNKNNQTVPQFISAKNVKKIPIYRTELMLVRTSVDTPYFGPCVGAVKCQLKR